MNTYNHIKILPLIMAIAVALGLCPSCREEGVFLNGGNKDSVLTLYLPSVNTFHTRADGNADAELNYTSLLFCAFSKDGSNNHIESLLIDEKADGSLAFHPSFKTYDIKLEEGDYRFYLLANIPIQNPNNLRETDIIDLAYSIPEGFNFSIPSGGIPMSAPHTDFYADDKLTPLANNDEGYYHYDGKGGSIYALLTFLYAKITVVPQDAADALTQISEIKFGNISAAEPIVFKDNFTYGNANGLAAPLNPEISETSPSVSYYIPERYVAEASASDQSNLNLRIGGKDVTLHLGQLAKHEYEEEYDMPGENDLREIRRGVEYTYTLTTSDKIILHVQDWNKDLIFKNFVEPVFLHIEKQVYEVNAGESTAIWYDSNVGVSVESPKFEGKDLFTYEIVGDSIHLSVNKEISKLDYDKIKESNDRNDGIYDFIHIIAGNIHKKVTIYPLNLDYYFEVDPTSVTIDVKLRVASGEYQGELPINIHTNYPKVQIALADGWDNLPSGEFQNPDEYAIKIRKWDVNADGNNVFTNQLTLIDRQNTFDVDRDFTYAVSFRGLNSGLETWKKNRKLTFTITPCDENGTPIDEKTETVTINVIPALSNYTIYFKPERNDWNNPHIFVYQCLEFPADYQGTWNEKPLASQPIGYISDGYRDSALEYSFTGAVTFRGWGWPSNFNTIYNPGGVPLSNFDNLIFDQGFYMFSGGNDKTWIPRDESSNLRYNKDLDYCHEYREGIGDYCPLCVWGNESMNRQWPGIRMKPAGDDWFYFELTDIADPGRTLIMFADAHIGWGEIPHRFPGDGEVGIPLFDFPLREGWLQFNGNVDDRVGNQFVAEKPE